MRGLCLSKFVQGTNFDFFEALPENHKQSRHDAGAPQSASRVTARCSATANAAHTQSLISFQLHVLHVSQALCALLCPHNLSLSSLTLCVKETSNSSAYCVRSSDRKSFNYFCAPETSERRACGSCSEA